MLDILYGNIQWIFSGVGVPVLFYLLRRKRKGKNFPEENITELAYLKIKEVEQESINKDQEDNYRTSFDKA